jgi:hypothetical protein
MQTSADEEREHDHKRRTDQQASKESTRQSVTLPHRAPHGSNRWAMPIKQWKKSGGHDMTAPK